MRFGVLALLCMCFTALEAQRVTPAALGHEERQALETWNEYLASKRGRYSSAAGMPSPLWVRSEQKRWPVYDLASFYIPNHAEPEVLSVQSVISGPFREYMIRTRFSTPHASPWSRALTMTVYATKEDKNWRIANALPRRTARWKRDTIGGITYVYAPGYPYDRVRARNAARYVDSLALVFGVGATHITYYLGTSIDEVYRLMGLESAVKYGPTGGVSQPVNGQLFSGMPSVGEDYRHELAHMVLRPLMRSSTTYFISEGIATWTGGTSGMKPREAMLALNEFLERHPSVTLDSLLSGTHSSPQLYAGAAAVVAMIYEVRGVDGVRSLFGAGPTLTAFRDHVASALASPWPQVMQDWRSFVRHCAGRRKLGMRQDTFSIVWLRCADK